MTSTGRSASGACENCTYRQTTGDSLATDRRDMRKPWAVLGVALWLAVGHLGTLPSQAQTQLFDAPQERQAIYPAYEGFRRNEDGSLTLSFAYFSHNSTSVTIPLGAENFFAPGPGDLGQPTTFHPGHHRWKCVVVVEPEFDGNLRWTLSHAEITTSTSEAMLQYNWEFSASDDRNALRSIEDPTTVPRGVCLNRPPIVRVLGYGGTRGPEELHVAVGEELKLFGSIRDEGLPRGGELTSSWRMVTGPGEVSFEQSNQPRTLAVFTQPGTYEIELSGSDSALDGTVSVTVIVSAS